MKVVSRFKRLIALVLVGALIFSDTIISVAATSEVQLSKVTVVDANEDGRTYDVTYAINVEPTYVKPSDVVIVLDRSNSMLNKVSGTNKYIVDEVKAATIAFIEQIMAIPGNRVAIVGYGTEANVYNNYNYFTDETAAINAVNTLLATRAVARYSSQTYYNTDSSFRYYGYSIRWTNFAYDQGATNIKAALVEAEKIISTKSQLATTKSVVLFTDGEPTEGGSYRESDEDAAIRQAHRVDALANTSVYAMGYFGGMSNSANAVATLNQIDSSGTCKSAPTTDELATIFSSLSATINTIGSNAVVFETLTTGFVIVPGSLVASAGTATESADHTNLTWNLGEIGKGTYTLNMKIKVLDTAYVGGQLQVPTSTISTLSYLDMNGVTQTIDFPINLVDIAPFGKFKDLAITTRDGQKDLFIEKSEAGLLPDVLAKVTFTTLRDFKLLRLQLADNYPNQDFTFTLDNVKNSTGTLVTGFTTDENEIIYEGTKLPIGTYVAEITIKSPSNFPTEKDPSNRNILIYDMEVNQVITQELTHLNSTTYPATSSKLSVTYNAGPEIVLTPSTMKFATLVNVNVAIDSVAGIVEYKCVPGDKGIEYFSSVAIANAKGLHDINATDPLEVTAKFTVMAIGVADENIGNFIGNGTYTVYAKDIKGKETVEVIKINNLLVENPDLK